MKSRAFIALMFTGITMMGSSAFAEPEFPSTDSGSTIVFDPDRDVTPTLKSFDGNSGVNRNMQFTTDPNEPDAPPVLTNGVRARAPQQVPMPYPAPSAPTE